MIAVVAAIFSTRLGVKRPPMIRRGAERFPLPWLNGARPQRDAALRPCVIQGLPLIRSMISRTFRTSVVRGNIRGPIFPSPRRNSPPVRSTLSQHRART